MFTMNTSLRRTDQIQSLAMITKYFLRFFITRKNATLFRVAF